MAQRVNMEPIEPRLLFAAPTATIQSREVPFDRWEVVVTYRDTDGDLGTQSFGANDLRISGDGFEARSQGLAVDPPQPDGSRSVVYVLPAPGGLWDYADTGRYSIGVADGEVFDQSGNAVAAGEIGGFYLWFTRPNARVLATSIKDTAYWLVALEISDDVAIQPLTLGQRTLEVQNSRGYQAVGVVTSIISTDAARQIVEVVLPAPGALFDFTDNAIYEIRTLAAAVIDGAGNTFEAAHIFTAYLWFTNPRVELLNVETSDDQLIAALRYSDDAGIDPSSFQTLRPALSLQGTRPNPYLERAALRTLTGPDESGRYIAVFTFNSPGTYWSWQETGSYTLFALDGVADVAGNRAGAGPLASPYLWWNRPAARLDAGASTQVTPDEWFFEMTIRPRATLSEAAFINGDITVTGPGFSAAASLVSVSRDGTGLWHARYRVASGPTEFANGTYRLSVERGRIQDAAGAVTGAGELGSFYLWFR